MAKQTIATIKTWFVTNAKPIQQQFADWLDSFRHKDDKIGMSDLTTDVQNKINTAGSSDPVDMSGYLKTTDKGIAGGVASLGTDGKVPASQLPVGQKGDQGLSAFQVWVAQGNPNDLNAFWEFLQGADGEDGETAYQIAVDNGYTGTQAEWLASLKGTQGTDGRSAYQVWVDNGNTGTVGDFLASLKGPKGDGGAATWSALQDKPTTIAGFGITNAYTKAETDAKLSAVYRYKGSVANFTQLPDSDQVVGDVYNITDAGGGYNAGDNVAWTVDGWDVLAGFVDVSGKQDRSEKNQANGYAGLDANGRMSALQFPYVPDTLSALAEGGSYQIPSGVTHLLVNPPVGTVVINYTLRLPVEAPDNTTVTIVFGQEADNASSIIVNSLTMDGGGNTIKEVVPTSVVLVGDVIEYKKINNYWRGLQ